MTLPVFTFEICITGLVLADVVLLSLSSFVRKGVRRALMIVNALGHTIGTLPGRIARALTFPRPMPGFYSSAVLFAASVYLLGTAGYTSDISEPLTSRGLEM